MKHSLLYFTLLLTGFFTLAACNKDKGNYAYTDLPGFRIDTTNLKREFIISQYETLELPSNLDYEGDKSKLSYSWTVYMYTSGLSGNQAVELSTEENLVSPIALLPEKYYLQFTATNKENGRRTSQRYIMHVESVGAGMLVLYEKEGKIDCNLIKTKVLEGLQEEDVVIKNLYSLANPDNPLTGNPVAIGMFKFDVAQYISIYTENNGVVLSPADMSITKNFKDQFFSAPAVTRPQGYFAPYGLTTTNFESSSGFELLVNDGKCYANMVLFAFGRPSSFSLMTTAGDYMAAPFPLYGLGRIVIYDQLNGRFLGASPLTTALTPIVSTGTAFNFQTIGKDLISINYGFGGTYMTYGVFKNKVEDGKRFLYVMDFGASAAKSLWDISHFPGITTTTLFTSGTRGQLMYYAVKNKIYQIQFDLAADQLHETVDAWPNIPVDETITCIKLCPHPGRNVVESAKDKYLFVGTYNETTGMGKVYLIQANVTSGVLQQTPVAVYEDFGRIKDMAFKF